MRTSILAGALLAVLTGALFVVLLAAVFGYATLAVLWPYETLGWSAVIAAGGILGYRWSR